MEAEKNLEEMMFADIQNIRNPKQIQNHEKPLQHPEERTMIRNLQKLEYIKNQARKLQDQIHEHPFDFMSIVIWEVQLEKLAFDEGKLLKRNEKLWKAMEKRPPLQQHATIDISKIKTNPNIGYKPIRLSTLANLSKDFQLQKVQHQLEDIYERKNEILFQIQKSETGIANPELNRKLDEVIQIEARLLSKAEELGLDIETKALSNKSKAPEIEVIKEIEKSTENKEKEPDIFEFESIEKDDLEIDNEIEILAELEDLRGEKENDLERE